MKRHVTCTHTWQTLTPCHVLSFGCQLQVSTAQVAVHMDAQEVYELISSNLPSSGACSNHQWDSWEGLALAPFPTPPPIHLCRACTWVSLLWPPLYLLIHSFTYPTSHLQSFPLSHDFPSSLATLIVEKAVILILMLIRIWIRIRILILMMVINTYWALSMCQALS